MQRVTMLIRGILKPCKILIIDEPTTGLDENTARNVKKMIIEETVGKTMIVITHSELMLSLSSLEVLDVSNLKCH